MIDVMTDTTITQLPLKPGTWALDTAHARVGFAYVKNAGWNGEPGHDSRAPSLTRAVYDSI